MPRYAHYISQVMCGNCREVRKIRIPIKWKIEDMRCPHCGRKELHHPKYFFTDDFYYNHWQYRDGEVSPSLIVNDGMELNTGWKNDLQLA